MAQHEIFALALIESIGDSNIEHFSEVQSCKLQESLSTKIGYINRWGQKWDKMNESLYILPTLPMQHVFVAANCYFAIFTSTLAHTSIYVSMWIYKPNQLWKISKSSFNDKKAWKYHALNLSTESMIHVFDIYVIAFHCNMMRKNWIYSLLFSL